MRQPTARQRLPGGGPTPGPADFKLPQLQAGLGEAGTGQSTGQPNGTSNLSLASGSRRLHSRTCAASHLRDWEGQAAYSRAAGRRTPRAAEPRQSSMPSHRRIRTRTKDVRHRQQRPVRTGSAVSQYEQPPEGGPPPDPAVSSCLPGAAGRAVGFHGSRAAGPHSNISSGQHHGVHVGSQSALRRAGAHQVMNQMPA